MDITHHFKEKYSEKNILSKCKERKCGLLDISKNKYLILNGDNIKGKTEEKSVDCIIIDLKPNNENKYRIVLCELTSGSKNLIDARDKFKASGKLIVQDMDEIGESIYRIDCLLLGKIIHNGQYVNKKFLKEPFKIEGFNDNIFIQKEDCNFSIKKIYAS